MAKKQATDGVNYRKLSAQMEAIFRKKQEIRLAPSSRKKHLEPRKIGTFASQKGKRGISLEYGEGGERTFSKEDITKFAQRAELATKRVGGTGNGVKPFKLINRIDKAVYKLVPWMNRIKRSYAELGIPKFFAMKGNIAEFAVNTSHDSTHPLPFHRVMIRFEKWNQAMTRPLKKPGVYKDNAAWAEKQEVSCHCDCDDWRFRYSYLGYRAGYGIIPETAYPKIRNPRLKGSVCIHLYRVLNSINSSPQRYAPRLAVHMKRQAKSMSTGERKQFDVEDPVKGIADDSAKELAKVQKDVAKALKKVKAKPAEKAKIAKIRKEAERKVKIASKEVQKAKAAQEKGIALERKKSLKLLKNIIGEKDAIKAFAKAHPKMSKKEIETLAKSV